MKICFLILCHSSAVFLLDLTRFIDHPDCQIIVHIDGKAPAQLDALASGLTASRPNVWRLPSQICSWGSFSLTRLLLDGIEFATHEDIMYDHFVLLSEQHLPLITTAELMRRLEPRTSYVQTSLVSNMHVTEQADIRHRFGRIHQEVKGVGSFARERTQPPETWLRHLHHGSQWVVLSVDACHYLIEASRDPSYWTPFTQCLLSDELAVPTTVMRGLREGRLQVKNWNPTFVATPQMGGTTDMVMTHACYHRALTEQNWFIRKRPATLPDALADILNSRPLIPPDVEMETVADIPYKLGARYVVTDAAEFIAAIKTVLPAIMPGIRIETLENLNNCPPCFVRLRQPDWPNGLAVCILSHDMQELKILCASRDNSLQGLDEIDWHNSKLNAIKARIYDLFSQYEIIIGEDVNFGFASIATTSDILGVIHLAAQHVERLQNLIDRDHAA
ncbi:MAG: beta-1,6-N-acetylglucosaminyltransferase [Janthinobacterium lividum]